MVIDKAQMQVVSKSKDGKRAMVIVLGEVDGKPYTATRHVERQGRNGPFVGLNPDPRTETKRAAAGQQVVYWKNKVDDIALALNIMETEGDKYKDLIPSTKRNLASAEACLETATRIYDQTAAEFPTKVEFQLA